MVQKKLFLPGKFIYKRQRQLVILFSARKADAKRAEASRKQYYKLALSDKKYFHRPQRGQWIIVLLQCVSFSWFRVSLRTYRLL